MNRVKLVSESLNEFRGAPPEPEDFLGIFIDEEHYDYFADDLDDDPYDGKYEGFSELPVYEIPGEIDLEDQEDIDSISDNRDNFPIIGKVLVGFDQDNESLSILKIIDDTFTIDTLDNIEVLFPPL